MARRDLDTSKKYAFTGSNMGYNLNENTLWPSNFDVYMGVDRL